VKRVEGGTRPNVGTSIYFLLVRRVPPVLSPVLKEVFAELAGRGFRIESGIAEEMVTDDLVATHDLYVLKSHTELSLSLAGVLHLRGARLLNPYPNCAVTQNKIVAAHLLRAAGVPTPAFWVTGDLMLLRDVVEDRPLIIKPYLGHRGAGLQIVRNPTQLADLPPPEGPVLVQEYVEGSREDLKIYVVGEQVFGVRKPFSSDSFTQPGRPCSVTPEVRKIALRCGQVFGLGLYGLDLVESPSGPWVVDLNTFPGYKGVPNIAPLIADFVASVATGRVNLPEAALPVTPDAGEPLSPRGTRPMETTVGS
jgi:ribosomal protein S6--L-glutamate ligase